jgi:D-glycero-D-manno-heptose 1,7-bisphosphate phosphatase
VSGSWKAAAVRGPVVQLGERAARRSQAVFLDRDGTINEAVPDADSGMPESPLRVEDVRLLPGAAAAAKVLSQAGYALVCASNQPAAAKGKATVEQLLAVHDRVVEDLAREGLQLDASYLCLHHPEGVVADLAGECNCRKPRPGMLLQAAVTLDLDLGSSWMLGDTDTDVEAGRAAGCRTALIEYPQSAHKRRGRSAPLLHATDLADGAAKLVDCPAR